MFEAFGMDYIFFQVCDLFFFQGGLVQHKLLLQNPQILGKMIPVCICKNRGVYLAKFLKFMFPFP